MAIEAMWVAVGVTNVYASAALTAGTLYYGSRELGRLAAKNKFGGELLQIVAIGGCVAGTASPGCFAAASGWSNATVAMGNGASFEDALSAGLRAGAVAYASALAAGYIGDSTQGLDGWDRYAAKGALHGGRGALTAMAMGGDPVAGFLGGGLQGATGDLFNSLSPEVATTLAGLISGVATSAAGGKFEHGFVVGAAGYLYNELQHRKRMLEVLIAEPTGWGASSFGHSALAIDDTVYSFGPNGMTVVPKSEYLAANGFRSMIGHELAVTDVQADGLSSFLSGFNESYNAVRFSTCVQPVVHALRQIGVDVGTPVFPVSLGNAVLDSGRASRTNLYPQSVDRERPWYYPTESAPWAKR